MAWMQITNEQEWQALLPKEHQSFLWSWSWGEAQRSLGKEVKRIVFKNSEDKPLFAAQAVQQAKFLTLNYWMLAYGPFQLADSTDEETKNAIASMKDLFSTATFLRLEPRLKQNEFVAELGLLRRRSYQPAVTRLVDLSKSEEVLLAEMHSKTRYNARLAERHGVTVRLGTEDDIEKYIALEEETAKRDGFKPLSASYVKNLFKQLSPTGLIRLRMAEKEGVLLAASIETVSADTVTYLFGASSSEQREAMAPFALHLDAILSAKAEGKHWYDLWGCNPDDEQDPFFKPGWKGITRFKSGWGGELVRYAGTWDLPLKPALYKLIQKIRNI
ncbi:MAG: peptidoglycan bridge formation glycyltransferase FemA/FemB family protein [Patescibacteria group bacterium]